MSRPYTSQVFPSAPVLEVTFGGPGERPWLGPFEAIVDTGGDTTMLPSAIIQRLKIRHTAKGRLHSAWGSPYGIRLYIVDVDVEGIILPGVVVAAGANIREVILGRTILNRLPIFLDGPDQHAEILDDRFVKRLRDRRRHNENETD